MVKTVDQKIKAIRHSLSHLLSMAVEELYPKASLGVGPAIENGFYQDYGLPETIKPEILPKLEKRIKELIKEGIKFEQHNVDFAEAYEFYKHDPYKTELIDELKVKGEKTISFYRSGSFDNLCAGPHVESTEEIDPEAFKLTSIAGAYWRGDEKNKMLQRIYGVAFESKKELDEYLELLEEAKKRDHRKLGEELELFTFSSLVGKGLPLWLERGAALRRELERFIVDEEIKRGYKHVMTPDIANLELYKKSGHYPYYKESMYAPINIDEEQFMLRPMTCPHHFEIYNHKPRSYKELPMRIAELGKLYRYEKSGELSGLMRVRSFCLADSHIICTKDQAKDEIIGALDLIEFCAELFGLKKGDNYSYRLSLGDRSDESKYYKDDEAWERSEDVLRQVLQERQDPFVEARAEAAFYGPKIDIQMKNVLGKEETAFTVQYDFVMPKRFNLVYMDADGKEKEAIVIHRSSIGAIERMVAFLIEHTAGKFPVWLAPEQIRIITVNQTDKIVDYAQSIASEAKELGLRPFVDSSNESVGKKIRIAEEMKVPYTIVVGEKEVQKQSTIPRIRQDLAVGELSAIKIINLLQTIANEAKSRATHTSM
jgi:threonyl-tRNA synthetase